MTWATPKTSSTSRGYDGKHVKARAQAAKQHSPTDPCSRCKHPLGPMGPHLHYDHNQARDGYLGFSHGSTPCPVCGKRCNITAGARVAQAKSVKAKLYIVDPTGNGCPTCGRTLEPGRKYCSQRCGWIAHKNKPPRTPTPRKVKATPEPRACAVCGQPVPKGRRRHCSDACVVEWNARINRERYRAEQGLPSAWEQPRKPHTADRW